jgi:hypothetical protein
MRSRSTFSESVPAKVILESISNNSMTKHGCTTNYQLSAVGALITVYRGQYQRLDH